MVLLVVATPERRGLDVGIAQLRRRRSVEHRVRRNVSQGIITATGFVDKQRRDKRRVLMMAVLALARVGAAASIIHNALIGRRRRRRQMNRIQGL